LESSIYSSNSIIQKIKLSTGKTNLSMDKITYRVNCSRLSLSEVNNAMSIASKMSNPETRFIFYAEPSIAASARLSRDFTCFSLAEIPHLNNINVDQLRMMYTSIEAAQAVIASGLLEDTSVQVETPSLVVIPATENEDPRVQIVNKKQKPKKASNSELTPEELLIYNSMVVEETAVMTDDEVVVQPKEELLTIEVGVEGEEATYNVKN
jgi:hypothetical protein